MKDRRTVIKFQDRHGRHMGAVVVEEGASRGNRHFNPRRPDGPPCPDCGASFAPVCPTARCPGRTVPLAIIKAEKRDGNTRRYDEYESNVRSLEATEGGRGGRRSRKDRVSGGVEQRAAA